ncbi:alpha/beta fold hydrolase [Fulvivirga lutea]|uniref:Alpha/beta hydrolase n=1 Tax=Fulvivirga lutea TaxID=2810512 RepID=A0A974WFU1_9BACT|nr:alpha/beta hydrolase [Fulvivirga lutea]QSE97709.1 alpha/beta hydrolase [Fulvivirga lutea]
MKTQKKIKTPIGLRLIAWAFPKVEMIAPWLAKRWFVKIFFSTAKYKTPYGEVEIAGQANKYQIQFKNKQVQVYEWGEGKPVLFVHGWMGRATQFRKFIPLFTDNGYKVVAFDSTGHGQSDGSSSHLMEFVGIIEQLQNNYRKFEMIVGHSLGGVASFHATLAGISDKLVLISSPTVGAQILEEFRSKIGASEKMLPYFEERIMEDYGKTFEEYSISHNITKLRDTELLIVHDRGDREAPYSNAKLIHDLYPSSKIITTEGNGHTRILKDEKVINEVLQHLKAQKYNSEPSLV